MLLPLESIVDELLTQLFFTSAECTTVDAPDDGLEWQTPLALLGFPSRSKSVCCDLSSLLSQSSSSKVLVSTPNSLHFSHDEEIISGTVLNFRSRLCGWCVERLNGGDQLPEYFECWNSRLHIRRNSVCFLIEISLLRKPPLPPNVFVDIVGCCWGESGMKYFIGLDVRVVVDGGVGSLLIELWPLRLLVIASLMGLAAEWTPVLSSYDFCWANEYLWGRRNVCLCERWKKGWKGVEKKEKNIGLWIYVNQETS